jgi:hypothetical protein
MRLHRTKGDRHSKNTASARASASASAPTLLARSLVLIPRFGLGFIVLLAVYSQGQLFGSFLVELQQSKNDNTICNIHKINCEPTSSPVVVDGSLSSSPRRRMRDTAEITTSVTMSKTAHEPVPQHRPHEDTDRWNVVPQTRRDKVKTLTTCFQQSLPTASKMMIHTILDDNSQAYEKVRMTWNQAKTVLQYPDVVVLPTTPEDVSTVITCARHTDYYVCGRNGKHSFEGDTCTYGIVVDTTRMISATLINYDQGIVRMESGMTLGRVAVELEAMGLILPMGQCASVGVTGLMLVGGQGLLGRQYGMLSDQIDAIELVDARGTLIRATPGNEYADYLWLARGGGSGVQHFPGIITAVETINLPKLPGKRGDKVYTTLHIDYEATIDNAAQLLLAWQTFYLDPINLANPLFPRLTIEPWLKLEVSPNVTTHTNGTSTTTAVYTKKLSLEVYFFGNDTIHQQFFVTEGYLEKILQILNGGTKGKLGRHELLKFHRRLSGINSIPKLKSGQNGYDLVEDLKLLKMNRWKGYSAIAGQSVTEHAFRELAVGIFDSQPLARRYVELKPLGGAIRNKPQSDSAFWHRNAQWWVLSSHFWLSTDSKERIDAIHTNSRTSHDRFIASMGSSFTGLYAGYIDRSDSPDRDLELYYGDHASRIAEIKRTRDTQNLFRIHLPNNAVYRAPFASELGEKGVAQ